LTFQNSAALLALEHLVESLIRYLPVVGKVPERTTSVPLGVQEKPAGILSGEMAEQPVPPLM
jgi:hypothetical protein